MVHDHHSYPSIVTGSTSEAIYIPYMGAAEKITPDAFSLLETHGGSFVADRLNTLTLQGGFLVIQGLSGGDYDLLIKNSQTHISVQIADGPAQLGYAMGGYRLLELPNPLPLQIVSVWTEKDLLKIQLANAGKTARVHVAAAKYMPEFSMFETLMRNPDEPASATFWSPQSFYVSGRNIGDEYRYILDRKYATHFPGNMLDRPGLLLNPWAINKTETAVNEAQAGEAYEKKAGDAADKMEKLAKDLAASNYYDKIKGVNASPNLDYLSQTSAVLTNLVPDDHGLVTVKLADLGPHQQIRVLALDGRNTAEREVSMGEKKMDFLDLRLGNEALDPSKHFVEQKEITAFTKGQTLTLDDIGSSRLETYASVGRVYRLYQTLSNDPKLVEFSFVLDWPKMKPEQKREKYSQFACHELNFFLSKKDPEFFEKVVQPYLKNKKDKTFLDHYLIGDDLSSYVQPWAYAQLNTAEKILLAQRLAGEAPKTARHVNDLYDLIPPDIERLNFLFKTALASASMDTGNIIGNGGLVTIIQSPDMLGPGTGVSGAVHALGGKDSNAQGEAVAAEDAAKPGAPPAPEAARAPMNLRDRQDRKMKKEVEELDKADDGRLVADKIARSELKRFYRALDKTQEWAENNYYHLLIADQNAALVGVDGFWLDYAKHDPKTPFLSTNFAQAGHNFTEMMLAMALLDLPFEAARHDTQTKDSTLTLKAGSDLIAVYKETKPAAKTAPDTKILVSQNYFRADDRYRYEGNEKFDKYVTDEFLLGVVYGCQIVVTNPTSSPMKLDLLLQVPKGSMPVSEGLYTRDKLVDLGPYSTTTFEYYFYFPLEGQFPHYGVQVARNETLMGFAASTTMKVVAQPTKIDTTSWDYVSQNGKPEDVLRFLSDNNIERLGVPNAAAGLDKIAWRMKDADFFAKVIDLLDARHVYSDTLWSYALLHNVMPAAREYLRHRDDFVGQCGLYIDTTLLQDRPRGAKALPAPGVFPAGQRPRPQAGARPQDPQRPLLRPVHAPDGRAGLPPEARRRGPALGDLLPAAPGPHRRGAELLRPGQCRQAPRARAVRLPGRLRRLLQGRPRRRRQDRRQIRRLRRGPLAKALRRGDRPGRRDRRQGRAGRRRQKPHADPDPARRLRALDGPQGRIRQGHAHLSEPHRVPGELLPHGRRATVLEEPLRPAGLQPVRLRQPEHDRHRQAQRAQGRVRV